MSARVIGREMVTTNPELQCQRWEDCEGVPREKLDFI